MNQKNPSRTQLLEGYLWPKLEHRENILVRAEFGSRIYGTVLPESDTDYKSIFLPNPAALLWCRAGAVSVSENTKENDREKNTAQDVDQEFFSLHGFLQLLLSGQTVATDFLFVPEAHILQSSHIWQEIQANRTKALSRNIFPFIAYCREQSTKYGLKGVRVEVLKKAINLLAGKQLNSLLGEHELELSTMIQDVAVGKPAVIEYAGFTDIELQTGKLQRFFHFNGKKIDLNSKVTDALKILNRCLTAYGHRSLSAEQAGGISWKSLYHAVRVIREAKELLQTGVITFPRPEKELLLQIRKGELSYAEVADLIEREEVEVRGCLTTSSLPEVPDYSFWRGFLEYHYGQEVLKYLRDFSFP